MIESILKSKDAIAVPCLINPKRNGVAIIVRWKGKILVCQRIGCRDMNGSWQFPGGAIEEGESARHAVTRELWEETGLNLARFGMMPSHYGVSNIGIGIGATDDGHPHVTTFYLIDFEKEPLVVNKEPEKHSDWEWVKKEEFLSRKVIELTRLIVENLK